MPQSQPTANPRYQEEEKKDKNQYVQNIFFLFSAYKNVKSFYTGKIAKKKRKKKKKKRKKKAFCWWHLRPFILLFMAYAEPVYSLFRTPTLPELQGPTTPIRDR